MALARFLSAWLVIAAACTSTCQATFASAAGIRHIPRVDALLNATDIDDVLASVDLSEVATDSGSEYLRRGPEPQLDGVQLSGKDSKVQSAQAARQRQTFPSQPQLISQNVSHSRKALVVTDAPRTVAPTDEDFILAPDATCGKQVTLLPYLPLFFMYFDVFALRFTPHVLKEILRAVALRENPFQYW